MSDSFAVEFKNVTKAFGDVQAVRDLNFSIEKGQLVTLLGPSGCGKTTTLRLIAGLEIVTDGQILSVTRKSLKYLHLTGMLAWSFSHTLYSRT